MVNIGIIQMSSEPLLIDENLQKAEKMISNVAKEGADIVVLPEMFNVGFSFDEKLMKLAEPLEGRTVTMLKDLCSKYNIYIITSIYELFEDGFYNTMVMIGSDRSLQIYRKRNPTVQERIVWTRAEVPGPGVFDTPFGRIGGAICFDSFSRESYEGFKQSGVEFVVIVALWGTIIPNIKNPDTYYFSKLLKYQSHLASEVVPQKYANKLNVPVAYVNQSGVITMPLTHPKYYPLPDWKKASYAFVGNSNIYDCDGKKQINPIDTKSEYSYVVPVEINQENKRKEVSKVNIPPAYMKKKYYFV